MNKENDLTPLLNKNFIEKYVKVHFTQNVDSKSAFLGLSADKELEFKIKKIHFLDEKRMIFHKIENKFYESNKNSKISELVSTIKEQNRSGETICL